MMIHKSCIPQAHCTTLRLNLPLSATASSALGRGLWSCNSGFLGLLLFFSLWALGAPSLPARRGCFNTEETPSQQDGFLSRLWWLQAGGIYGQS